MAALLRPHFQHRQNDGGSFDSICSTCFVTVASAEKECDLAPSESMQKCEAAGSASLWIGSGVITP
jgi:hypothetical protein